VDSAQLQIVLPMSMAVFGQRLVVGGTLAVTTGDGLKMLARK
jgi:hypothetical protein